VPAVAGTQPIEDRAGAAREAVAAAARRLAAEELVPGTSGNVSVRTGEIVAISPTGARLGELEAADVALVDLDGRQLGGPLAPTSELGLHLGVLRERGDAAVVHTHAPFTTALACALDELPVVHYAMLPLGGPVRVAPYATFGTPELAESVRRALDGRTGALMASHGGVTVAHDADAAVELALLLEWACTLYWRAAQVGTPHALSDAEQRAVVEQATALAYGTPRAVAGGEEGA
jgi:L-fuculose-phosphate aldolase